MYKEAKKPGFKCLSDQMQNLIIIVSVIASYQEPVMIPISFLMFLFLKQLNVGKTATTIPQELDGSHINFIILLALYLQYV